ncbi:phosphohydrolase [Cohaesibacter gelatinilyticus]|uniref:Metal dependent phosphohydrolase n=1 Tax=Cohaesibacter gelatinilyticus TaxID=372072 RepID=A0A285PH83_9HYPH|nr:phosphohydrolase [Cohaesibacter gelatinilyticus]SNZ19496.1 metal dependent phosphohydrolase [Cohaesibacter gelatinilyticus]
MPIFNDVSIPDSQMCKTALEFVKASHEPFLLNHVMRTYFFGSLAAQRASAKLDQEMFFLGAVMHDLGLVEDYVRDNRFEIDGANAAADFLLGAGYPDDKIEIVWDAIALHTTLGIPQSKRPEIGLVQLGAGIDVGVVPLEMLDSQFVDEVLVEYPRADFKNKMLERIAEVVGRKPHMTMHTFAEDILERHVEGHHRHNFCDAMHGSAFAE